MPFLRCSCGAAHPYSSLIPIGRQQGTHGEFAVLTNCPSCGSTFCMGLEIGEASATTERRGSTDPRDEARCGE